MEDLIGSTKPALRPSPYDPGVTPRAALEDLHAQLKHTDIPAASRAGHILSGGQSEDLEEAALIVTDFARELTREQATQVYTALRQHHTLSLGDYGAEFDVSAEIGEQLGIARAMRARLLDSEGRLSERFSAREAKEVVSACSTLITVLMKSHKELMSFRRILMIENAVKAALDTLPREAQDTYLAELTRQLEAN